MIRAIGILALDVVIFMTLFIIGAAIQSALPWPTFVVPFLFLPPFLYMVYRDPDRCLSANLRGLVWMTITASVAMGVVFDIMRFPVGSWIANVLFIGMFSIAHPYCFSCRDNKSSPRST